jgi:hypothetical protein
MFSHATIFLAEKSINLKTVDLKKLEVWDLKKIISDWEEDCEDCMEKRDFMNWIEKLKPKYDLQTFSFSRDPDVQLVIAIFQVNYFSVLLKG